MHPIELVTLLSIIYESAALNFIPQTTENVTNLQRCTTEIQRRYGKSDENVVYISFNDRYRNLQLQGPVIIQNGLLDLVYFQWIRAQFYVIEIPRGDFERVFNFLVLTKSWNPRAKFVVFIQDDVLEHLVAILRKYFVYNIVFVLERSEGEIVIMTYHPFNDNNETQILAECRNGHFGDDRDLFPDKLPKTWENFPVRLILFAYPPFVIVEKGQNYGMEVEIFKMVKSHLRLRVEYVDKPIANWGRKLSNGSYEGAYGYLRRYEVEGALGLFYANASVNWDFDQSYPYMEDDSKWVVPAAKRQARWIGVTKIFQPDIWAVTLTCLLLVTLVLCLYGYHFPSMGRHQSFWYSMIASYKTFLGQSTVLPRTGCIRVLLGLWIFFGLVMTSAFQGRLISVLNFSRFEKQIANIDDLRESKIAFGYYKDAAYLYSNPKEKDKFLYHNFVDCPIDLRCLNRTAFKGDFATFKPKKFIEYLISTIYLGKDGRPLVYAFKDNIYKFLITVAFAKGFPILPEVNKVLLHLRVHGFIDFYYKKANYLAKKAIKSAVNEELFAQVLEMNDVFWVFCLLIFGLAISTYVLLVEVLIFKYLH
ncbi:uncharacterized protein LOC116178355 [Photinus pyralis]|uniref:uncharacterized protein LOC116178355 n=1 Tax=Photinus pyralis TaxID=7054 RepID=UPI0012675107|nr:uncharacterized protein LOC116178355 [Photinus pyralis]